MRTPRSGVRGALPWAQPLVLGRVGVTDPKAQARSRTLLLPERARCPSAPSQLPSEQRAPRPRSLEAGPSLPGGLSLLEQLASLAQADTGPSQWSPGVRVTLRGMHREERPESVSRAQSFVLALSLLQGSPATSCLKWVVVSSQDTGVFPCRPDPEAAPHSSPAGIPPSPPPGPARPSSNVPRGLSIPGLPSVPLQPCPAVTRAGAQVQRELTGHPVCSSPPQVPHGRQHEGLADRQSWGHGPRARLL